MEEKIDKVARCPQCGKVISFGRPDRRFCSVSCKNRWHNRRRYPNKGKEMSRVLRVLYKNREVLEKLMRLELNGIDRPTLIHLGFNLNYFTSLEHIRNHWVYSCLDIRYELTPTRIKNLQFLWEGADGEEE